MAETRRVWHMVIVILSRPKRGTSGNASLFCISDLSLGFNSQVSKIETTRFNFMMPKTREYLSSVGPCRARPSRTFDKRLCSQRS